MARTGARLLPLTPAHLLGVGALQVAVVLALIDGWWAVVPLGAFVLVCAVAPFFPAWRLFGPIVTHGDRGQRAVALTFDDGPDPDATPALLDLLARHGARATFFVVGDRAVRHPDVVRRALAAGHELGNHSATHDPLLMLRPRARLAREIAGCQGTLATLGVRTLAFRPPVGIVNPRLWPALLEQGLVCVGFSRRARDLGNRRVRGLARRLLRRVRPGDILLLHDGRVRDAGGVDAWLEEIERVLRGLEERGLAVRPLSELTGRPLVERLPGRAGAPPPSADPVAVFYDGLAARYDAEQERPSFSYLRRVEERLVLPRLDALVGAGDRALEIGAGTGRFTLALAERAREVTAIELSAAMAGRLRRKAASAGRRQVEVLCGDARDLPLGGPYRLICAFSALEYVRAPGPLLLRLAAALEPGGTLLVTTAHASLPRLFVQIGNAMRQGLWLAARRRREMARLLASAGLEPVEVTVHGAGMLLLAQARRPGASQRR